ncbi:helix-turn-helix domain protein (plasmid) [Streptantibioticus cattleyicolor NRRL 8057 = DSM 46488]|uniref:Helix-turn-helix domain protein n=1 Tax=Streptantibioticus cattleyicolor (strain ATCC 35852 / DSM 46488 / JCM 4925 / NBRC 14057 / NRRL 8057) TaxID=1003195 RepID=F8JLF6_STREN|nr:helix-turn-helix domain protein [Streptantibioticus cattleyicolor NRRL 8057 = DSM 46488]CCB72612.1 Helix-turn-helix protein [Streptantibioticus cattleyicolor NRRL 8057 = DSM 46488]
MREFGEFLRSRRDRVRPGEVGLPVGARRRVPGLRRDEVAVLAGASVDYYNQLEQGRGAQPSEQMVAALARALRLTEDERNYLYFLAGRPVPPRHSLSAHVHPGMLDLLERLPGTPAAVITDLHATLVQNRLATALLGPVSEAKGREAGFVHRWFTDPQARARYHPDEHDHQSRVFVADLRAVAARRGGDEEVTGLVGELLSVSAEFADLWARHEVAVRRADRKRLIHPELGVLELDCLSLLSEDGSQRLLWFTAPVGGDAAEKLALLDVLGSQEVTTGDHRVG